MVDTVPGALPLVGHAIRVLRDPLGFLDDVHSAGPVVKIRLGPRTAYVVTRPELVRRLLVDEYRRYDKGGSFFDAVRLILRDGVGTCPHERHRRLRVLVQPAFHPSRLADYAAIMRDCATEAVERWRPGGVVQLTDAIGELVSTILARTLMCTAESAEASAEMARAIPVVFAGLQRRLLVPVPALYRIPTPANRRFERTLTRLRAAADRVIAQYRHSALDHPDLLTALMSARDAETGEGLSNDEIQDQILTMLLAGIDTTATGVVWTLFMAMRDPEIEKRLWSEIDEVLGGKRVEFADLDRLPYCRRVLLESLRYYPPAPMSSRITVAETELAGIRIPAGADVFWSPYGLNRDPEVFPEPDRFDPDRWLPERFAAAQRQGFMTFGSGPRKCVADQFALLESMVILATVVQRWRLVTTGSRLRTGWTVTFRPAELPVTAIPRS